MDAKILESTTLGTGGGTLNLPCTDVTQIFYLDGGGTLSSSWTIQSSGTPSNGMRATIYYRCNFNLNGNAVTIFGRTFNMEEATKSWKVEAIYQGSWLVFLLPNYDYGFAEIWENAAGTYSSATILTLNSIPQIALAKRGAGKAIEFISGYAQIFYATPYNAYPSSTLELITDTATQPQAVCTHILAASGNTVRKFFPVDVSGASDTQLIANKDLMVTVNGYNPSGGTSTLALNFLYRIVLI